MTTAEHDRLAEVAAGAADWRRWGTYLSERAWGTVREDYSADGDAWASFPFEHARSRAYRWNEDGLAGWCDRDQTICLGLSLWNGRDPFLKERPFGLTNAQGNHGEDAKDYWFYTDNLPTHAYAAMTYKYPQVPFPYDDLVAENARLGQDVGEYELFDALRDVWLANRYFDVQVEYAKASPEDVVLRVTVVNRGTEAADIHVLPHLWYRNTWTWQPGSPAPRIRRQRAGVLHTEHPVLGERWLSVQVDGTPVDDFLFCENETNSSLLFGSPNASPTAKDGINDAVVHGAATTGEEGSKAAAVVRRTLGPGESMVILVRFAPADLRLPFAEAEQVLAARRAEADEFHDDVAGPDLDDDQRLVHRQAIAGLLWCKQFYHYGVRRWLQGDPGQPVPPPERWSGRNSDWQHLANHDVLLMPDAWEYPWYAAWDLAFHCVAMAQVDPQFAKDQILLMLSSTYQHPHGQLPAYEWSFGDTNPPLYAWATWQVYQLDRRATGVGDHDFLASAYRAVTLEVMWWLNQKDARNRGVFGGGFLGMDNIGVFDRDQPLPTGGALAQIDGTAWMAALVLQMLEITVELAQTSPHHMRMFGRWVWDAWLIANALEKGSGHLSFWDDDSGFYHDVIEFSDGSAQSIEVFSMQSLVPLFASIAIPLTEHEEISSIRQQFDALIRAYEEPPSAVKLRMDDGDGSHFMAAVVNRERLARIMERVLDPEQFLSPFGVRSLSRYHRDHPYTYVVGDRTYEVAYAPAESTDRMFGGNSNWRGPVWFPMNVLLVQSINTYSRFLGDTMTVPDPTGSESATAMSGVADDLADRLTRLFLRDADGRRPVIGDNDYMQHDPHWRDLVPFYEYFDGDTGKGLGASHQTGWTAMVALLLRYRGDLRFLDLAATDGGVGRPGPAN